MFLQNASESQSLFVSRKGLLSSAAREGICVPVCLLVDDHFVVDTLTVP